MVPIEYLAPVLTSTISAIISAVVGYFMLKMRKREERIDREEEERRADYKALRNGLQCMLRDRLIFLMQKAESDGYAPLFATRNVEDMHKAYKELDGNGLIDALYARFKALPHIKPEEGNN